MMAFAPETKDPDSTILRAIDWNTHLASGDSISTSAWSVTAGSISVVDQGEAANVCTVKVSGGVVGEECRATNEVTTAQGETLQQSLVFKIAEL